MARATKSFGTIMNAKSTTGIGDFVDTRDFRSVLLQLSAVSGTSSTIKLQASLSDEPPDFSATQSSANHWDYIESYDLQSSVTPVAGDTGHTYTAVTPANSCLNIMVNTELAKWVCLNITAITAGSVTTTAFGVEQ